VSFLRGGVRTIRLFLIGRQKAHSRSASPNLRTSAVHRCPKCRRQWMCLQQDLRDQGMDPRPAGRASPTARWRAQLPCAPRAGDNRRECRRSSRVISMRSRTAPAMFFRCRKAHAGRPPIRPYSSLRARPVAKYRDEFAAIDAGDRQDAGIGSTPIPPRRWPRRVATFFPDVPKVILCEVTLAATRTPACGRARPK